MQAPQQLMLSVNSPTVFREDTHAWLEVSAKEYSQAVPINFGAERIEQISKASGIDTGCARQRDRFRSTPRHALIPLDPSNWRRLFVRNGRVLSSLPELVKPTHNTVRHKRLLCLQR